MWEARPEGGRDRHGQDDGREGEHQVGGARVERSDQRNEDRDDDPCPRQDHSDDGERLAPGRSGSAGSPPQAQPKTQGQGLDAHATRIRGSTMPYRMSTVKLTTM